MALLRSATLLLVIVLSVVARTPDEWKSRTIYQLLTDRFARTDNSNDPCADWKNYCGGTWKGIQNNLDYIQGMGFDAIWISPIIENTDGGYHGYWAKNIYAVNSHFGTEQDLHDLINACHERDIWVMVDVVANHMAPVGQNFGQLTPFNDAKYFHNDCVITDFNNQDQVINCWLYGLADLAQERDETRKLLLDWISDLVQKYEIDGLRIDTIPYVTKDFWYEFSKAAGVYTIGEANLGDFANIASFQGPVNALVNYPLFWVIRPVFQYASSMTQIKDHFNQAKQVWPDMDILGNFIACHDTFRFLAQSDNKAGFQAAVAFVMTITGIPLLYQGDEQYFKGGDDPSNREPLWGSMNPNSEMYQFVQKVVKIRKDNQIWNYEQKELDLDDNYYSFKRGNLYFSFTNSLNRQERQVYSHGYAAGTKVCNLMVADAGDCLVITSNGMLDVILNNGEVKIWAPSQ